MQIAVITSKTTSINKIKVIPVQKHIANGVSSKSKISGKKSQQIHIQNEANIMSWFGLKLDFAEKGFALMMT